jgi:putative holliday junction resolvase
LPRPDDRYGKPRSDIISCIPSRCAASGFSWSYTGFVRKTQKSSAKPEQVSEQRSGTILALDYGRRKIGIALADCEARIAEPFMTLERINRNEDMRRLREFARDHHVKQIIVGLPLRLDGVPGEMAEEARRFAERVRKQLGLPVKLVDERLTSWEAERILEEELGRRITHVETREGRKKVTRISDGKYTVDAVAAMVILRDYLAQTDGAKGAGLT